MKKLILTFGMMLLLIASCQNESLDSVLVDDQSLNVEELTGVQRDIMVNILSSKFGGYRMGQPKTRALNSISMTPYVSDGDTLLYIVQYADGWEIYSASHATNMMLFSSDRGHFDLNDPNMPPALKEIIIDNAEGIKTIIENDDIAVDPSWGAVAINENDFANGKITINNKGQSRVIKYPEIPSGTWVLIETETLSTKQQGSPKLTVTNWHQRDPWNRYSKLVESEQGLVRAPAGCVPIAISQYLYYTHNLNGIPATTVSTAVDSNNGTDFLFSGNSSMLWDKMATDDGYFTSGVDESALFIGYIGRELRAQYSPSSTSVQDDLITSFLNKTYGTTFTSNDLSYSDIKVSLDRKYPVLALAATNKSSNGDIQDKERHAFIIDSYRETVTTQKYVYGLIRDPWPEGVEDPYASNDVDENGNVIGWAYTNEIIKDNISNTQISMNWGFSYYYNYTYYSPYSDEWSAGGHIFNLNHIIFKRADIK